jgi:tetratricopeptide (TPR) repeat protein
VARRGEAARFQTFWDHNDRGVQHYRRQAYDLAAAAFERAVGASPLRNAALEINLGAACLRQRRYIEARGWLEKGGAMNPDDQRGHWFLAQALRAIGAFFDARAELERTYALDPDSPEGRLAEEEIARWRLPWRREAG